MERSAEKQKTASAFDGPQGPSLLLWYLLLGITAAITRLPGLAGESLFMDEIAQTSFYGAPPLEIVRLAASHSQPPLDYWIGSLVSLVSYSDFAVRLPAAIFGILTVWLMFSIVTRLVGFRYGLFSGLLLALLPYHIYFSQEARPYSIAIFLFLALFGALLRILERPSVRPRHFVPLLLIAIAYLYSRGLQPLLALASSGLLLLAIALIKEKGWRLHSSPMGQKVIGIGVVYLLAFFSFLWLLPGLIEGSQSYAQGLGGTPWDAFITGITRFSITPLWQALQVQLEPFGPLIAPLALGAPLLLLRRENRRDPRITFAVLLLPVIATIHLFVFQALSTSPLRPPYLISLLPLSLICLSLILREVMRLRLPPPMLGGAAVIGLIAVIAVLLWSLNDFRHTAKHTDWRGTAAYLRSHLGAEEFLLVDSLSAYDGWEPNGYLFARYMAPFPTVGTLDRFHEISPAFLRQSRMHPVLTLFFWRDYRLTGHSPYPFHPTSYPLQSQARAVEGLAANQALELFSTTGLMVISVRPEYSTGSMAQDTLLIIDALLASLRVDDEVVDLLLTAYRIHLALGSPAAAGYLQRARALVDDDGRVSLEKRLDFIDRHESE